MNKENIGCVYKITSPSNKIYIGSTINFIRRFKKYKSLGINKQIKLYNSFLKYGFENHIFEIVWEGPVEEMLFQEFTFGKFYDVLDKGLNLRLPKINDTYISTSIVTRNKISNALKGKKQSEEQKRKQKIRMTGVIVSKETKLKMSNSAKGKIKSFEHRLNLSKSKKGKKISLEQKEKLRLSNLGKKQSPETILKRTLAHKKPVIQMDLNGNFIREWDSAITIQKELGIKINQCISGRNKKAGNFKWELKNKNMDKLKEFIKNNQLSFLEGERNSNITILCGYALHIKSSIEDCKNSIPEQQSTLDVNKEIERVYNYAKIHNYKNYWSTPEAKNKYKF